MFCLLEEINLTTFVMFIFYTMSLRIHQIKDKQNVLRPQESRILQSKFLGFFFNEEDTVIKKYIKLITSVSKKMPDFHPLFFVQNFVICQI